MSLRLLFLLLLLLALALALGAAVWTGRLPALRALLPPALQPSVLQAPGAAPALPGAAATQARKCRRGSEVVYTDGACPPGTQEQALTGGAVSVLPASPAPTPTAAASAASAQTPLRRLAGQGDVPDRQERMIDQALKR